MEINGQLLYRYFSRARLTKAGLDRKPFGNTVYRTRRFYCGPLTVAGRCSTRCLHCKEILVTVIENVGSIVTRDPEAMLVYQLRKAVAEIVEQPHAAVVPVDLFGNKDTTSVWDTILAQVPA